jgi:hypothetical protein
MIEGVLWTLILSALAGAVAWTRGGVRTVERRRVRARIRETPLLTGASVEGHRVRITGTVMRPERFVTGTLTGRAGVIARTRAYGAGSPHESFECTRFSVDTAEHGVVEVDARYAELSTRPLSLRGVSGARRRQHLREHALSDAQLTKWSFEEIVVEPGSRVTLVGQLSRDSRRDPTADERGFRDDQQPVVRIGGTLDTPLLISDAAG